MTKTEALKQALEALKESQTDNDTVEFWERKTIAILKCQELLAQPEQEPVACVIDGDLYFHHEIDWEDLAYQGHGVELLYTSLPKREWVGLTDEEVTALYREIKVDLMGTYSSLDIYRALEAKLKEKNT